MPASDYTSTISGGLKLKGGAKDAGVKKKKSKKSKTLKEEEKAAKPTSSPWEGKEDSPDTKPSDTNALTLSSEREEAQALQPSTSTSYSGAGKTEAQRRHEEIKRKRVRLPYPSLSKVVYAQAQYADCPALTARRTPQARRRRENTQAARRGAEQVPLDAVGAPRHAAHWPRITRASFLYLPFLYHYCSAFARFLWRVGLSSAFRWSRCHVRGLH